MDVDIDDLYEKHFAWKRCLQEKDDTVHMLNEQLKAVKQVNAAFENIIENSIREMTAINETLSVLSEDITKYKDYEPTIKDLFEDNERLTQQIQDLEKAYGNQVRDVTCQLSLLKSEYERTVKKMEADLIQEKNEAIATMEEKVKESERKVVDLEASIEIHERERKTFLHLKNEYEKQFLKTKEQELTIKQSVKVSTINEEIFRKKYENLEKIEAEKDKEIKVLQERIEELKRHNKRLIETNHSKATHRDSNATHRDSNMLHKPAETYNSGSFQLSCSQTNSVALRDSTVQRLKPALEVAKAMSAFSSSFDPPKMTSEGRTMNSKTTPSNLNLVAEQRASQKTLGKKPANEQKKAQLASHAKKRKLFNKDTNFLK